MKKFLLPVDDSIHSTHALQYMAMMASVLKDFIYIPFCVQPIISDYLKEEAKKVPKAAEKLKQLEQNNSAPKKSSWPWMALRIPSRPWNICAGFFGMIRS